LWSSLGSTKRTIEMNSPLMGSPASSMPIARCSANALASASPVSSAAFTSCAVVAASRSVATSIVQLRSMVEAMARGGRRCALRR
jgi:hypothetical protein